MLGYMIYFFPLAGFSQELIKFCKNTVLHRDPRLFPEQTASAQRAMAAYLRRMAETMGGSKNNAHETTKTILPYPSLRSGETNNLQDSHANLSAPSASSTALDYHANRVNTTASGSVNRDDVPRPTATNNVGKKKNTSKSSSASAQNLPSVDKRRGSRVRTPAKRGLELLASPSTGTKAKKSKYV